MARPSGPRRGQGPVPPGARRPRGPPGSAVQALGGLEVVPCQGEIAAQSLELLGIPKLSEDLLGLYYDSTRISRENSGVLGNPREILIEIEKSLEIL